MSDNNFLDSAVGAGIGYAVYKGSEKVLKKPYQIYLKNYRSKFFNEAENEIFKQKGLEAFHNSKLSEKGVNIVDINPNNFKLLYKKLKSKSPDIDMANYKGAMNGERAFFSISDKNIVLNTEKRSSSIFHEMGHALNRTSTDWKNKLLKVRLFSSTTALMLPILGLCTEKESFFNENCGKLTFLALTPLIAEEALASRNGQHYAKGVLDKNLFNKLKSINTRSLGSYFSKSIATGLAAALGVLVKNAIAE